MLQVVPLTADNQQAALSYLRRSPYRNALPLSNISQLRSRCDVLIAAEGERVLGMASTYHDLPLRNITFVAERIDLLGQLLWELAGRNSWLWSEPAYTLLPAERHNQLANYAQILATEIEYQMTIEPETLRLTSPWPTRRLTSSDLPAIEELARASGLTVWHNSMLDLGPAFGCFVDEKLVAMAATHFATAEIIEIGHIATHPDHRRQGYASACTIALTEAAFKLAPRVFLMVLEHNTPALAAYKQIGFRTAERFYLTRFRLAQERFTAQLP